MKRTLLHLTWLAPNRLAVRQSVPDPLPTGEKFWSSVYTCNWETEAVQEAMKSRSLVHRDESLRRQRTRRHAYYMHAPRPLRMLRMHLAHEDKFRSWLIIYIIYSLAGRSG